MVLVEYIDCFLNNRKISSSSPVGIDGSGARSSPISQAESAGPRRGLTRFQSVARKQIRRQNTPAKRPCPAFSTHLALRPRRFGKSTTVSMLKYFFYGAIAAFQGLTVFKQSIDFFATVGSVPNFLWNPTAENHYFPPIPVIHLDFSSTFGNGNLLDAAAMEAKLIDVLVTVGLIQGVDVRFVADGKHDLDMALSALLYYLSQSIWNKWGKVVVLVDEYDYPFNRCTADDQLQEVTKVIENFFRAMKSNDSIIKFAFVTGITSYGMPGIYSGANNFVDISYSQFYHELCGFTTAEVMALLADVDIAVTPALVAGLKDKYHGYSWLKTKQQFEEGAKIYNPFAIAEFIRSDVLENHWSKSSSENILTKCPELFQLHLPYQLQTSQLESGQTSLPKTDDDFAKVLVESGYATIVVVEGDTLTLDWANGEVRDAMVKLVTDVVKKAGCDEDFTEASKSWQQNGSLIPLFTAINKLRGDASFRNYLVYDKEMQWSETIRLITKTVGIHCYFEINGGLSRSDFVCFNSRGDLVIVEIKLVKTPSKVPTTAQSMSEAYKTHQVDLEIAANEAIDQIIEKRYFESVVFQEKLRTATTVRFCGLAISECCFSHQIALVRELIVDKDSLHSSSLIIGNSMLSWLWIPTAEDIGDD